MNRKNDVITVTMPDKTSKEFPFSKRVWVASDLIGYNTANPPGSDSVCEGITNDELLVRLNYAEDLKCRAAARALAFPTKGKKAKCDWAKQFMIAKTAAGETAYREQWEAEGFSDAYLVELYEAENPTVA